MNNSKIQMENRDTQIEIFLSLGFLVIILNEFSICWASEEQDTIFTGEKKKRKGKFWYFLEEIQGEKEEINGGNLLKHAMVHRFCKDLPHCMLSKKMMTSLSLLKHQKYSVCITLRPFTQKE